MWIIAVYDCPMTTVEARQDYTLFRKSLLKENFYQLQNSLYVRHYPTKELAEGAVHRLKNGIPEGAKTSFFLVTDKQYSMSREFFGPKRRDLSAEAPKQVELF
tara:strand:+ start:4968 stop:5276 length:309 start_codon:yes stop_codon:yes gene_type:complete